MILFGEGSLRKAIHEFMAHYHGERTHQGLGNRLLFPDESHTGNCEAIRRRARLGGMLNYYYLLPAGSLSGNAPCVDSMTTINRTSIVVRRGQPFPDWLHRADPTSGGLSLEDLRREPTVYLLPECENEEEARECLKEMCGQIFEEQLDGWYRVPSSWPGRRDRATFDRWNCRRAESWALSWALDTKTNSAV
jgi:hypothetical protein